MTYGKLEGNSIIPYKPYHGGLRINGLIILNPTHQHYLQAGYYPIVEVLGEGQDEIINNELIHYVPNTWTIDDAREELLLKIEDYDTSEQINGFYLGNTIAWIPRETRVALQNSTAILLKNNIGTATLWNGVDKYEIPCRVLLAMLDALEMYALECFNKTAEHKANAMKLETIEEIENYDYTTGYPEKLDFSTYIL